MGMKYSDNGTTKVHNEIDLGMAATGETDGGIGWKVEMGLDSNTTDATQAGAVMLDQFQYQVTLVQSVLVLLQQRVQQLALVTSVLMVQRIDDAAHKGRHTGSTTPDVQWNYTMDDIAIHASTETSTDDTAVAVSWTSGSMAIAVSHSAAGASAATANAVSVGTSVGGFAVEVTGCKS